MSGDSNTGLPDTSPALSSTFNHTSCKPERHGNLAINPVCACQKCCWSEVMQRNDLNQELLETIQGTLAIFFSWNEDLQKKEKGRLVTWMAFLLGPLHIFLFLLLRTTSAMMGKAGKTDSFRNFCVALRVVLWKLNVWPFSDYGQCEPFLLFLAWVLFVYLFIYKQVDNEDCFFELWGLFISFTYTSPFSPYPPSS